MQIKLSIAETAIPFITHTNNKACKCLIYRLLNLIAVERMGVEPMTFRLPV